jgi:hypothetical protein
VPVEIRVPVPASAKAGDRLQIYTDFGTGTVDLNQPLLVEPILLLRDATRRVQTFKDSGLKGEMKSGRPAPRSRERLGTLSGFASGLREFRQTVEAVVHVPAAYGPHKFAARIVDAFGNAQEGPLPEVTVFLSSLHPPGLRSFALADYDSENDRITFSVSRNSE